MNKFKKEMKGIIRIIIVGIILIMIFLFGYAMAQGGGVGGNDEKNQTQLQEELNNLTQYLISQGYSWLVNYSIEKAKIEVYNQIVYYLNIGLYNKFIEGEIKNTIKW